MRNKRTLRLGQLLGRPEVQGRLTELLIAASGRIKHPGNAGAAILVLIAAEHLLTAIAMDCADVLSDLLPNQPLVIDELGTRHRANGLVLRLWERSGLEIESFLKSVDASPAERKQFLQLLGLSLDEEALRRGQLSVILPLTI